MSLPEIANLLILLSFLTLCISIILSVFYSSFRGIGKNLIYYSSLGLTLGFGLVINFSILDYLHRVTNGLGIIKIITLLVLVCLLLFTYQRFKAYSKVNGYMANVIIYPELFMFGMLITNIYEVFT